MPARDSVTRLNVDGRSSNVQFSDEVKLSYVKLLSYPRNKNFGVDSEENINIYMCLICYFVYR